jgi:hypothetical protein
MPPGCTLRFERLLAHDYFTEMCSGSEAGLHLRLVDFVYHSTLGLRATQKRRPCPIGLRVEGKGLRVEGAGFRVQGSGFRVQSSWCRVQDSGFRVQGSCFRVQGPGSRVQGFRVQGSGCRIQGLGFRVQGSGFRVQGSPESQGPKLAVTVLCVPYWQNAPMSKSAASPVPAESWMASREGTTSAIGDWIACLSVSVFLALWS